MSARHRMLQEAARADDIRWLPGARLNIAESALWGRDDSAPALRWADESSPQRVPSMTWAELRVRSVAVACALQAQGLQPGACTPESVPCPAWCHCCRGYCCYASTSNCQLRRGLCAHGARCQQYTKGRC